MVALSGDTGQELWVTPPALRVYSSDQLAAGDIDLDGLPEIIGERYGEVPRLLSVVALVLAYLVIVSYQYNAGGAVLQTILTDTSGRSLLSPTAAVVVVATTLLLRPSRSRVTPPIPASPGSCMPSLSASDQTKSPITALAVLLSA